MSGRRADGRIDGDIERVRVQLLLTSYIFVRVVGSSRRGGTGSGAGRRALPSQPSQRAAPRPPVRRSAINPTDSNAGPRPPAARRTQSVLRSARHSRTPRHGLLAAAFLCCCCVTLIRACKCQLYVEFRRRNHDIVGWDSWRQRAR